MKLYDQLKSTLERYLLRGAAYQLLAVAALIGVISVVAGVILRYAVPGSPDALDSVWWAFLRLTDPGYLGDDQGFARRVIATIVTVLGYVLFMGSLVAIMTQWLNSTIRRLEQGYTAIHRKNHILVLGWTVRAGIVVGDLLASGGRVRRFLSSRGERRLHVVVLAQEVTPKLMQEVRSQAAQSWDPGQITLRSGSALRGEHLLRVDFLNASAILLPAGEFTEAGPDQIDTHTIKTLLSLSNHPRVADPSELPLVVAEILDERKVGIARSAYRGPVEVLASDTIVSRLIAQNVRQRGLSYVYSELLTHRLGNEIYIRAFASLAGRRVAELHDCFSKAILLGVLSYQEQGTYVPRLNADAAYPLGCSDRLVLIARSYEDTEPDPAAALSLGVSAPQEAFIRGMQRTASSTPALGRRVLLFGWSHKVPALLAELLRHDGNTEVSVASALSATQRHATTQRYLGTERANQVRHFEADYTNPAEVATLKPEAYDNVVFMGSDWVRSGEASDARTIVGYLVVSRYLAEHVTDAIQYPSVIVELLDAENVGLLGTRPRDVLISPVMLSHMLAQVALRRELSVVFGELFAARGAEIAFRSARDYGLSGRPLTFAHVRAAVAKRGETALGFSKRTGDAAVEITLNPDRVRKFELSLADEVVVIADHRSSLT